MFCTNTNSERRNGCEWMLKRKWPKWEMVVKRIRSHNYSGIYNELNATRSMERIGFDYNWIVDTIFIMNLDNSIMKLLQLHVDSHNQTC